MPKFAEAAQLSIEVPLSYLDKGQGIEETPRFHRASWHKSCVNKCSCAKLTIAQKRKLSEVSRDDEISKQYSPIKTRRASLETRAKPLTRDDFKRYFFCQEAGKKVKHNFQT